MAGEKMTMAEERSYEKPKILTVKEGYWRNDNKKHPIKPAWCITWYGLHIRFYGDGAAEVYDDRKEGYGIVHSRGVAGNQGRSE